MAQRGKNFSPPELKQLCYSYLEISQDPCVGSGQKRENFWERVGEHYDRNKPRGLESRTSKSLESKWGDVRKATTRFIGCYKCVEDLDISGTNSDDTLIKAKELYKTRHSKGKEFSFSVCYDILKDCPRWMLPEDQMSKGNGKRKQSMSTPSKEQGEKEYTNLSDEGPNYVQSEPEKEQNEQESSQGNSSKRPLGSKLAKDNAKKMRAHEDAFKMAAQAQKVMAETGVQRLRVLESQTFMNMLTMPTEHLDSETLDFLKLWRTDQMTKLRDRISVGSIGIPSPLPPRASRSSLPTPLPSDEDSSPIDEIDPPSPQ